MKHLFSSFVLALVLAAPAAFGNQDIPAPAPLFAVPAAPPVMMINMSNDHQLYFKAYDDFSDLTGKDGPDTTYNHDFDYFGYFDSYKCYVYRNSRFEPVSVTQDKYCSGDKWSGNFLNWGTMTRIDIVRQILYGGLRSTDTEKETVLERSYLPNDAHSFAKYYNGEDLNKLTPFSVTTGQNQQDSGITMCNTTDGSSSGDNRWSQTNTNPPLMKVARGNFALWATNERFQCLWQEDRGWNSGRINFNVPSLTGILASPTSPKKSDHGLGDKNYQVRVQACVPELPGKENCKSYTQGNYKPIGLLQEYGENDAILFGLLTGSYAKNKSGGVLRRNTGSITSEINADGTFEKVNDSIIHTLDRLRISRYDHNEGTYTAGGHDNCGFNLASFTDGRCSNWGNPQAEIYLEALRYLAGKENPTSAFNANDSNHIPARDGNLALNRVEWQQPAERSLECSPLNILQFNASTISYDGDQLENDLDIEAQDWTDDIGVDEGIQGGKYIIGRTQSSNSDLRVCTAKNIGGLGNIDGLCPESPRLEGTYNLAGLARFAREEGLPGGVDGEKRPVRTFGVTLAPGVPAIDIPTVSGNHQVTLMPACLNTRRSDMVQNCAIVDFKIVELDLKSNPRTGRLYVNWEIAEQGGDFDSDMWGMLDFEMDDEAIHVTTNVVADSVGAPMGFGFTISGTTNDGFFTPSGINNHPGNNHFGYPCENCNRNDSPATMTFELSSSSAELLPPPLYLAAKWGGYSRLGADGKPAGDTNTYFAVTNPSELQASLSQVFEQAAMGRGTAVNLASDGIGTYSDRLIYQTRFFSENWTGELLAYQLRAGGELDHNPVWRASQRLPSPSQRNIITRYGSDGEDSEGQPFDKTLPPSYLGVEDEAARDQLIDYLRGRSTGEDDIDLRQRDHQNLPGHNALGHFVNSRPLFVSSRADFGHGSAQGQGPGERNSYPLHLSSLSSGPSVVYVGSNAGKLHAFDAETGKELFAYVPESLLPHLKELKKPEFNESHRYFVDGQIRVMDFYHGSGWKRLLVGSLGAGGQVLFGLDVTDPENFSASDVLWEKTAADIEGLGYQLGDLSISRLPGGEWRVVLSNGYASDKGDARLLFLNPLSGELEESITLNTSSDEPNGLSPPFVADLTRDGVADTIYAGDLHGNVWKIELDSSITSSSVSRLHAVPNNEVRERPITVKPLVTRHPYGGHAVHVATGRYFTREDTSVDISTQRYMTLRDVQRNLNDDWLEQHIEEHSVGGRKVRSLTSYQPSREAKGCFFELPEPGERVVAPLAISGDLFMTSLIPEEGACSVGARSFLFNFDPYTCGRSENSAYSNIKVSNPDNPNHPNFAEDEPPEEVPVSSVESDLGMTAGTLLQNERAINTGLQPGEKGSNMESGDNTQVPRIHQPAHRQWWRCFPEQEGDC